MTITLTPQDIIIDETAGFQDADVDVTAAPYSTNTSVQYLIGLDAPGGLTSPQVAFKTDFVVASASAGEVINSLVLTQSLNGTPFSTTDGVNSGIRTVDGKYVWLFQDATHANVVIGVIGTTDAAAEPAETGPLAFAFALVNTSSTHADLVTVEYVPLLHPDTADPDDRIDLTNKVFASATGTTTIGFTGQNAAPGNHDFYVINSPNDATKQLLVLGFLGAANATANVSTQGFGVNNQSINPTETLQVDFVTGGNLAAGTFSQIQYGSHLENITQAGFTINQITPSNPNLRVDIKLTALNVTGNEQGLNFSDGSPTTAVDITSIKLTGASGLASTITTDGTYATASGNITVTGLSGTGNVVTITGLDNITTVDFTTATALDRLLVTGVDANEGLDVTEFHFTTTTTNAKTTEVGSFINFDDDGPSIDPSQAAVPTLTVDETTFAIDASASFAGLFSSSFGNDGFKDTDHNGIEDADAISYKLGISANNAASGLTDTLTNESVTLSVNAAGTVVTGSSASGGTVFTITVNADTGEVTLDQVRAVVHDDPTDPDESTSPAVLSAANLVTLTATIVDGDGDTDTASRDIGNAFKFEDDGPSIDPSQATVPTLTVDETDFATNASTSFAGIFTSGAFGNDGFKDADNNNVEDADAIKYALGISAPNAASGLTDTLTNESVTLSVNAAGTVVTGSSATGGTVFTITVNADTGAVTLDQVRAVVHDDPNDPDESTSPAVLSAANLITLTVTITDGDGDTDTATRDIGNAFKFEDDGPSIDPAQATVPTLTVDETDFATNASTSFAGIFTSGTFGNDGFKDTDNNNIEDADAIKYALGISAPNAASGLTDTLTNESVTLSVNAAGTVVTGSSATGGTVFTITVNADTGAVTLDQVRAVVHDDPTDPDESTSPAQLSAANLVTLTVTITDGDGDTDTATRDIGNAFKFEDDGPSIDPSQATVPTLTVDETDFATNASASFAGLFTTGTFGNDGFKDTDNNNIQDADAIKYTLGISGANAASGLTDTLTNESVTLSVNAAGTVVTGSSATGGTVFTITVNATTGEVTLDQVRAVVHDDPTDPDESSSPAQLTAASLVTLTATITDGDGDTDTATRNIGDAFKFEDDGPSIDPSQATVPTLTVDETTFATNASASFAGLFTTGVFGHDGFKDTDNNNVQDADAIKYTLGISANNAASGLTDTLTNESVTLSVNAAGTVVTGSSATGGTVFTITVNASTGEVTLDQVRAVVHDDPTDPDESTSPAQLSNANLVTLTATITDGDGDTDTATRNIGDAFKFEDDGPSIDPSQATVPSVTVDETVLTTNASASFAGLFTTGAFGNDGFKDTDNNNIEDADAIKYALGISAPNVASGLTDTLSGLAVTLSVNAAGTVVTGSAGANTVFTITVNADTGEITLDQVRAVVHDDPTDPDESTSPAVLSAANLVTLTATITDGDGDTDTATRDIGNAFKFEDDGPTITVAFDADPGTPGAQTPEQLGNAVGQTASGTFGYDIGADAHLAAFYTGGGSDFVDTNTNLVGVQIGLTGTIDNSQNPNITDAVVTLTAESLTSASFTFSFHYDKDPITAGVQDATGAGTLTFNKVADTYTFTLTDALEGFSFDVLHTNELLAKQPTGNVGHPLIVAEQLTPNGDPSPFFVQFTGNSITQQIAFGFNSTGDGAPSGTPADTAFTQGAHDMVTNVNEDWVSATQSTNGVAGDTIQKGELLTLRFFNTNILGDVNPNAAGGGTERLDPTALAAGVVVKFDGIGASEDLVVILDLKDANGNEITRAINVQNSDMIKGAANVPFPYSTEFTLDNNDALLIIEQNDYTLSGETYQIQGMQIMQSANGLTGNAINLIGTTGANGGSSATSNLTAWDPTDNDVLKIVDIGFVQQTSGTINADLDFSFALVDADFDPTATQHLLVSVSNNWIV